MAKFCCAIRQPCRAKEPPSAEASWCLDKDFTPNLRRLQQLVVLLHHKVVSSLRKSHFVTQLDRLLTKNTESSFKNEAVVLYKWMAKMSSLIWTNQWICIGFKCLFVSKNIKNTPTIITTTIKWILRETIKMSRNLICNLFFGFFLDGPTNMTYYIPNVFLHTQNMPEDMPKIRRAERAEFIRTMPMFFYH